MTQSIKKKTENTVKKYPVKNLEGKFNDSQW
jgi:hypothetical protein